MPSFSRKFVRDNGAALEVDGSYRLLLNSIDDLVYTAWLWKNRNDAKAPEVTLTAAEDDRLHEEIVNDPDTWEYHDDIY